MDEIYLDHAAATPLAPEARAAMETCWNDDFANPSSLHGGGRRAKRVVEDARQGILRALNVGDDHTLVFTSGGTESNNTVVHSFAGGGGHVVASGIEHKCLVAPLQAAAERGAQVSWAKPDVEGRISSAAVTAALRPETRLVSVMLVNNELGTIQAIREIAEVTRRAGVTLHTDAAQALGKLPLDLSALGADLVTLSAHKAGGPKGIGAIVLRRGTALEPLLLGGGQENEWRSGTENVPAIAGFAAVVQAWAKPGALALDRMAALRDEFERRLMALDPACVSGIGRGAPRVPHILSMRFAGHDAIDLVAALDAQGVRVATGAACTAQGAGSPVLRAIGLSRDAAQETLRFSFGPRTTMAEIETVVGHFSKLLAT